MREGLWDREEVGAGLSWDCWNPRYFRSDGVQTCEVSSSVGEEDGWGVEAKDFQGGSQTEEEEEREEEAQRLRPSAWKDVWPGCHLRCWLLLTLGVPRQWEMLPIDLLSSAPNLLCTMGLSDEGLMLPETTAAERAELAASGRWVTVVELRLAANFVGAVRLPAALSRILPSPWSGATRLSWWRTGACAAARWPHLCTCTRPRPWGCRSRRPSWRWPDACRSNTTLERESGKETSWNYWITFDKDMILKGQMRFLTIKKYLWECHHFLGKSLFV